MSELQPSPSVVARIMQIPRVILLALLRAYKLAISPMLLPACRYVPTCSDYAAEAIERYGAVRGSLMALWRLLRCHPFVKGGFDPVPNRSERQVIPADQADEGVQGFRRQECPRHTIRACSH